MFQKDLRPNTATIAAATSAGTSNVGYCHAEPRRWSVASHMDWAAPTAQGSGP